MKRLLRCSFVALMIFGPGSLSAGPPGQLVEITWKDAKLTGAVISHSDDRCWFLEPDGRLDIIPLDEVGEFRPLGPFRARSALQLRDELAREYSTGYSVAVAGKYVVVAPTGTAQRYASLFDELYRQFLVTFRARGFRLREPDVPLVALVFPDAARFAAYCRKEKVPAPEGLRGYYLPQSNRVALFDSTANGLSDQQGLDSTVIHEAVHQVAFNMGLHARIGQNPKWIVEGLAMVLERESVRVNGPATSRMARVNPQRFAWFQQYAEKRRPPKSLPELIAADSLFAEAPLDTYSESWALTFYLFETRSAELSKYLQRLADRDHRTEYQEEDRLADFRAVFGRDLVMLEADMLRFYARLESEE